MGINTTRVGLYKPGGGSSGVITPDEAADIDKINGNSDRIDEVIGAPLYASSNLPGGGVRFDGMIILESDTNLIKVFKEDGATWVIPVGGGLVVADLDALPAASARPNVRAYVASLKCDFISLSGTWTQVGFARVANATARDTEYAKASGVYKTANAIVKQDNEGFMRVWDTVNSKWVAFTTAIYVQSSTPTGAPDNALQLY